MKKCFLLLTALVVLTGLVQAQTEGLNRFMEQHKRDKAFTFAYLSKDLLEVTTQTTIADKDWKKLGEIVKNIGSLKILAADNISNGLALYREARALLPAGEFDELFTVRDGQTNVRMWTKDADNTITDLVLLVGSPEEFVLVCFTGQLVLNNVTELAKLFDAREAAQLAQASAAVSIDFTISPNPSNGEFVLSYTDGQDAPVRLQIIDQNGRSVTSVDLQGASVQPVTLPDVATGLYWVQVQTRQGKVGVKQLQIIRK